jgi:hypothetical protein
MLRLTRHATSGRKAVALVAALAFSIQLFAPRRALAWDEQTHDWIVDWAFQVMKLVEYEADPNNPPLSSLQGASVSSLADPPAGCTGDCLATWNDLIAHLRAGRTGLGALPFGPENVDADQEPGADLVCAGAVTKDAATGRRLADIDLPRALGGSTPKPGETNSKHCRFQQNYTEGGIFESPELQAMPGRLIGTTLGFAAQAADARVNDWDVRVNVEAAILSTAGWLLTFGTLTDANSLDVVNAALQDVRLGVGAVLTVLFAIILLIANGFPSDADSILEQAWHAGQFLTHIDQEIFSILASPFQDLATNPTDYVGLGHFVNVQAQRSSPLGQWPSNEFDDQQGIFYDEALFDAGTDARGDPILVQDEFDHYIQDASSFLSPYVDPLGSDGVTEYQLLGAVDDYSPPSKDRTSISGTPDDDYWYSHELHEVPFTPLDNLAYHGWTRFSGDSCRHADALHWTLHAFGDAAVPLHALGTTGQGHVPFEQAVDHLPGLWDRIRSFSVPTGMSPVEEQHKQARRIVEGAAFYAGLIRTFQQNQPGKLPIRQLVTEEARKTLDIVRNQVPKLSCARDACRQQLECPSGSCGNFIYCNGRCQGFVTDPPPANPSNPAQTADPTDDSQPCLTSGTGGSRKCTPEAYVALALSGAQLANVPYPATLAPSLSTFENDGATAFARSYFGNYGSAYRALLENAAAATLAFLAYAAETIPASIPDTCLCASSALTYCQSDLLCHDLSSDHSACGSCGTTCAVAESCVAGACVVCSPPWSLCGGTCVNVTVDSNNCGRCGVGCGIGASCKDATCSVRGPF